ncbi:MAG: ATP-binding protein [Cyanobacteria bacterium J06649_4]
MTVKKHKIIFVAGIHGVGKTTLCSGIASKFKVRHFSASSLIKNERKEEHFRNKQVEDVAGNQDHLVTAINKHFSTTDWYLLDGHFCLLNKNNEITQIPYSTFEGIQPSAIIVLTDKPETIYSRLASRDDVKYNLALLRSFQEQEILYADSIREKLNIPCLISNPTESKDEIFNFIEDLFV